MHLILSAAGRRLCYLADDQVDPFVEGTDHVAVSKDDPRWADPAALTPGVDRPVPG